MEAARQEKTSGTSRLRAQPDVMLPKKRRRPRDGTRKERRRMKNRRIEILRNVLKSLDHVKKKMDKNARREQLAESNLNKD